MSVKAISWVFDNGPSDPSERLVLLAIADYVNHDGEWSPSMAGIASKSGMTERGARGVVRRLEAGGWIEVKVGGGRGGRSHYRMIMDPKNPERDDIKPERQTRNGIPGMNENPERDDIKPGTRLHKTRNQCSAEPSGTINKPSDKESARVREILSGVFGAELADEFIAHRKAKRAKITERAASLIAKDMIGHPNPRAVVEASIKGGWTGLFPDRFRSEKPDKPPPDRAINDNVLRLVAEQQEADERRRSAR